MVQRNDRKIYRRKLNNSFNVYFYPSDCGKRAQGDLFSKIILPGNVFPETFTGTFFRGLYSGDHFYPETFSRGTFCRRIFFQNVVMRRYQQDGPFQTLTIFKLSKFKISTPTRLSAFVPRLFCLTIPRNHPHEPYPN